MELTATTDDFGHPPHRAPVTLIEQILELLYERGVAVAILSRVLRCSAVSATLTNMAAEIERRFTALSKRAERAEAQIHELEQLVKKDEATIQRLKGHLALLGATPDGKLYPEVTALPLSTLPACWVATSDRHSASVRDDSGGVGRIAMERVGDRERLIFTYDIAAEAVPGSFQDSWAREMLERMMMRLTLVGQQGAPEGVIFEAPDGSPFVRLSPLVARLLADQVQAWRETLHPQEQEAQIAELLGLMKSGESFADARARIAATRASPT